MIFPERRCLFCGEAGRPAVVYPRTFTPEDLTPAVFSARRPADRLHGTIARCARCGLVYSLETLPETLLASLYAQSAVTYGAYAPTLRRDYWRALEPHLAAVPRTAALEIGCGSGFFLEELLERGFADVRGCEPSTAAGEAASPAVRSRIATAMFSAALFPAGHFTLVCSFQTLDHLGDPADMVRQWRNLLVPGGLVFVVVHDAASLQARLLGERSPIIDIEHTYLFTRATLRRLFAEAGFDVAAVRPVTNSYPAEYWLRMFPLGGAVREGLCGMVRRSGLGAVPLPLRAGNIALIARRPP